MNYPTDGRSIVTDLVWGILVICVCGSPVEVSGLEPPEVSGQKDSSNAEEAHIGVLSIPTAEEAHAGAWFVPVRDVEELDGLTRLIWTAQMIFVPDALAHVNPLYAYNPLRLEGLTVHPDRIGDVAIVRKCRAIDNGVLCANYMSDTLEAFHSAYDLASKLASEPHTLSEGQTPREVYFGTTYPIPGIEPDKRFVAELPR